MHLVVIVQEERGEEKKKSMCSFCLSIFVFLLHCGVWWFFEVQEENVHF